MDKSKSPNNLKMKDVQLVVLIGEAATRLAPLTYGLPKGLLSINQKPGLFNMINDFVKQGLNDITFILNHSNQKIVKNFFENAFDNVKFNFVIEKSARGPMYAFMESQPYITKPTLLLLGDTECETDFNYEYSWLGYKEINDNSHSRWCLINTNVDNNITDFVDKPDFIPDTNKALIGIYFFKNYKLLKETLSQTYECDGQLQLSAGISYYLKHEKIKAQQVFNWRDAGALNTYAEMYNQPFCYSDKVVFVNEYNQIVKISEHNKSEIKFLSKIKNYKSSSFFPRLIYSDKDKIITDYYDYLSIYEYTNYYPMRDWCFEFIYGQIIKSLNLIHNETRPKTNIQKDCIIEYNIELRKAIDNLFQSNKYACLDKIILNGKEYQGINSFSNAYFEKINRIISNANHFAGITCNNTFESNILYATRSGKCKFISPKGKFGNKTLIGDTRIDFAYLLASNNGKYEKIIQDVVYSNNFTENGFDIQSKMKNKNEKLLENELENINQNIEDLKCLASIILIKKASETKNFEKQCCLLAKAIIMINEILF